MIPRTDLDKRRMLIQLSSVSVAAIVILWLLYMNWTISPSIPDDGVAGDGATDIFARGLGVIARSVETGIVNSYMYFHAAFAESTTFTIHK